MKRIVIILMITLISTFLGVYFRPDYFLIGQMDWMNVLTKGYFVGSFAKFFTQGLLDESFYFVLKFSGVGLLLGILLSFLIDSGVTKKSSKKKKKA